MVKQHRRREERYVWRKQARNQWGTFSLSMIHSSQRHIQKERKKKRKKIQIKKEQTSCCMLSGSKNNATIANERVELPQIEKRKFWKNFVHTLSYDGVIALERQLSHQFLHDPRVVSVWVSEFVVRNWIVRRMCVKTYSNRPHFLFQSSVIFFYFFHSLHSLSLSICFSSSLSISFSLSLTSFPSVFLQYQSRLCHCFVTVHHVYGGNICKSIERTTKRKTNRNKFENDVKCATLAHSMASRNQTRWRSKEMLGEFHWE